MATSNELETAVFDCVYQSHQQQLASLARLAAIVLLTIKHTIRGLMFSWPLYLLALVPLMIENTSGWWVIVFLLPAIGVSGYILDMGIREDYTHKVEGMILNRQHFRQLLW